MKISELNKRVTFYEYAPNEEPEPGEDVKRTLYECWAKVDEVWLKDLELAKANGTLSDLTITIRDPRKSYQPNNKHYLSINSTYYTDKHFNIKHVRPDFKNKRFVTIVAEVST